MEFPITTYRSQALMNHLPLPSVLVDLIKNFVFFDTSTFYRLVEQSMTSKRIVCHLIIDGHSRAIQPEPDDYPMAYAGFYEIRTTVEPEKWSFTARFSSVSTYHRTSRAKSGSGLMGEPYSRNCFEIKAVNCKKCGEYVTSGCHWLTYDDMLCNCDYDEMPRIACLDDQQYEDDEYEEDQFDYSDEQQSDEEDEQQNTAGL